MSTPKAPAKAKPARKAKPATEARAKPKPTAEQVAGLPESALNNSRSGDQVHKRLTDQQAMFCEQYVIDFNGAAAARRAGYSEASAREQAYHLLTLPHIQMRVRQLRREAVSQVRFDKDKILERLSNELEADMADLFDERGALLPIDEWPLIWRTGLVAGIDIETTKTSGEKGTGQWHGQAQDVHEPDPADEIETRVVKIKLVDRHKKLELVGKHIDVMAFKERAELDVKGSFTELLGALAGTPLAPTQVPPVRAAPTPVAMATAAATNPDLLDDDEADPAGGEA